MDKEAEEDNKLPEYNEQPPPFKSINLKRSAKEVKSISKPTALTKLIIVWTQGNNKYQLITSTSTKWTLPLPYPLKRCLSWDLHILIQLVQAVNPCIYRGVVKDSKMFMKTKEWERWVLPLRLTVTRTLTAQRILQVLSTTLSRSQPVGNSQWNQGEWIAQIINRRPNQPLRNSHWMNTEHICEIRIKSTINYQ